MTQNVFCAPSGNIIVYTRDLPLDHRHVLLSLDGGKTLAAFANHGFVGDDLDHTIEVEDFHWGISGTIVRRGYPAYLEFNGEYYLEPDEPIEIDTAETIDLPNDRVPVWLGQMPDGRFAYVSDCRFPQDVQLMELYVGSADKLVWVPINCFDPSDEPPGETLRYEDDDYNPVSALVVPHRYLPPGTPAMWYTGPDWPDEETYEGVPVTPLDPAQFDITEQFQSFVTVTPK